MTLIFDRLTRLCAHSVTSTSPYIERPIDVVAVERIAVVVAVEQPNYLPSDINSVPIPSVRMPSKWQGLCGICLVIFGQPCDLNATYSPDSMVPIAKIVHAVRCDDNWADSSCSWRTGWTFYLDH